jgi:8-oxo-dGTP diphosphatase
VPTTPSPASEQPHQGFPVFAVTVDIVVFTMHDDQPHVLLIERGTAPFRGAWALPGGFKTPDETLEQAAARELREETGLATPAHLDQFRAYGDPERDPRRNVVTVAYLAVLPEVSTLSAGTDAAKAALHPVHDVVEGSVPLAFDHLRIVTEAADHVADQLDLGALARTFVPEAFTLTQLRRVYEGFWGEPLDPANFRRNLLSERGPYVVASGRRLHGGAGGRPPELFTATDLWNTGVPPVRRSRRRLVDS